MSICQDWDALHWYQKGGCTFAWKFLEEELWRWWHDKTLQCCRNWGSLQVSFPKKLTWKWVILSTVFPVRVDGTWGILFWCCFMASLLRWPMCGPYCFGGMFNVRKRPDLSTVIVWYYVVYCECTCSPNMWCSGFFVEVHLTTSKWQRSRIQLDRCFACPRGPLLLLF